MREDGMLLFRGRICVPHDIDPKTWIPDEAHHTRYTIHPGRTKMYHHNLEQGFWWNRMKNEITRYVMKCMKCQQVKAEHQPPAGKLQSLAV